MFRIVKRYYDKGIYSNEDVAVFVRAGKLTPAEGGGGGGGGYEEG